MKPNWVRLNGELVGIVLSLSLVTLVLLTSGTLERLNQLIYDAYIRVCSSQPRSDIAIIAIDEKSLVRLGRWPWSRQLHADLLRQLTLADTRAVGFDIVFPEANSNDPEGDYAFAQAIQDNGRVVLPLLLNTWGNEQEPSIIPPLSLFTDQVESLALVEVPLDPDGLHRAVYLRAGPGENQWPTLALAMARRAPTSTTALHEAMNAGQRPWVQQQRILVPFAGPPHTFPHYSFFDVLRYPQLREILRDKYVLIGVTAHGLSGELTTPVSGGLGQMSAVEFHANVLHALLENSAVRPLPEFWSSVLTLALIGLPLLLNPRQKPGRAYVTSALLIMGTFVFSAFCLTVLHRWFSPTSALLGLLLGFPFWGWFRMQSMLRQLFSEKERAEVTVNAIADGVIATDSHYRVQYMNPVAESLTGYPLEEARGHYLAKIFQPFDQAQQQTMSGQVSESLAQYYHTSAQQNRKFTNRSGEAFIIRMVSGIIRDSRGKPDGLVLAISDVSETQNILERVAYQATHDALTDLPNRALLMDRLQQAITQADRNRTKVVLMFIDLDGFKKINDGLGHASGDVLIQMAADRLRQCGREGDTVARLGGDEFVMVLEGLLQSAMIFPVAEKVLQQLSQPFEIQHQEAFISASIGISLYPRDGKDAEALLKTADTAMYQAKEEGKNNFQFFSPSMNQQIFKRLELEKQLRYALEDGSLKIHYQPQINLDSGRIVGVEALARWCHPELGTIPPTHFIALAEETGFILQLGEWVLRKACHQAMDWQSRGLPPIQMGVNLSPRQFSGQDIFSMLSDTLADTGLAPNYLKVEITENLLMKDFERANRPLHRFRELGGKVSIDDFGVGYSSLSYLRQIPVDQIKIDRSFVQDITRNSTDAAITRAIITMAHGMQLGVIAEGVENRAQMELLKQQRCNEIQGHYFSMPLPPEHITALLMKNRPVCADDDMG